ncbi:DUF2231 domain-containing protein [Deinococcus antarcticus]|uniref:DUF2231 domain-containing protein n=1 Tax=Deinococcus antarcticus TaxID=1298767 RepID=A0ABV8AAT6_9DEIO
MTTPSQQFEDAVARNDTAEQLARDLQALVRQAEDRLPQAVHDFLKGEFLGHPLHPVLVHLPLGGWMAAAILDYWPGGNEDTEKAADLAILLATVGAVPTVAAGWTEWAGLRGQPRRTGVVHGLLEETAFFLNVGSLLARRKGKRGLGKLLSGAGLGAALAGGMLGGQLVYEHGVGVKR